MTLAVLRGPWGLTEVTVPVRRESGRMVGALLRAMDRRRVLKALRKHPGATIHTLARHLPAIPSVEHLRVILDQLMAKDRVWCCRADTATGLQYVYWHIKDAPFGIGDL